jgi:hypothetical protein
VDQSQSVSETNSERSQKNCRIKKEESTKK